MADTGYRSPGTMASVANSGGPIVWSDPNNAKVSDQAWAMINGGFPGGYSQYLKATNFGFSVPDGAIIDGIIVEIERAATLGSVGDWKVYIVKYDGSIGTDQHAKAGWWPGTEIYYIYGSSSDLWSETWTPARINDVDFGVVLATTMLAYPPISIGNVDHIRIKVYYTEVALTNMKINVGDAWKDVDEIKINVGDSWKTVTKIQINIGDTWKTIFG